MTLVNELSYSHQLEMVVLGYALTSADGLKAVCTHLKKADFHFTRHQELFVILQEVCQKDLPLDILPFAKHYKDGNAKRLRNLASYECESLFWIENRLKDA
jgi:replicative DNA helicase